MQKPLERINKRCKFSQNEYFWFIAYVWNIIEALLRYHFGQIWHADFGRFARWWKRLNSMDAAEIVYNLTTHWLVYICMHLCTLILRIEIWYGYGWEAVYMYRYMQSVCLWWNLSEKNPQKYFFKMLAP